MKTLVSLLVGGVLLFGSLGVSTQAAIAQNRDRNNMQNKDRRDNDRDNNNHRRHRRHHRRHRRHRHQQHASKLSY